MVESWVTGPKIQQSVDGRNDFGSFSSQRNWLTLVGSERGWIVVLQEKYLELNV